ncbi:MAG: electron transfer flavoprotein subunit beta/FixA family protein, partial [Armatimonadetes bacterium]|nr:electron transfer flavoprotein subunit beta/FixA family protein [Armatimonadota bacterium]
MNTVVCIKQVPETTEVRVDPVTKALIREGVKSVINPFDENAIEAALQLREAHGGKVAIICMGPPQAEESLRQALAMGADEAILLTDPASRGSDTLATSYTLARMVRKVGEFDLVLCGKQAIDGDTGQVGPGLAERLGVPQVTFAIELGVADGKLRARRVLDDFFEIIEVKLPAVVTVVKQINEPRHPSMRNVLKAKRAEIAKWTLADLDADSTQTGFDGSPTQVVEVWPPERKTGGKMLEGPVEDIVEEIAGVIKG